MKEIYYKFLIFKGKLKSAIQTGINRFKYPVSSTNSSNWDKNDHSHFCLAAQILQPKDFEAVCPYQGNVDYICWCDDCDFCKYQATVDFNTDKDGKKNISLYISDKVKGV